MSDHLSIDNAFYLFIYFKGVPNIDIHPSQNTNHYNIDKEFSRCCLQHIIIDKWSKLQEQIYFYRYIVLSDFDLLL